MQARRLHEEFGVAFDWIGYELYPDELEWPAPTPPAATPENKPATPSRFDLMLAAEGIELPKVRRPYRMRTHNAHEAVEYAKTEGVADALIERLYEAYWRDGEEINRPDLLLRLATGIVLDLGAMGAAIAERRFADRIVGFDDPAYAKGVYNVPTFFIGDARYAEQPLPVLRKALREWVVYADLRLPEGPAERPYTVANMVATIDGKILTGERDESVGDLGSKFDHALMRRIESQCDAVLVGAGTLRTAGKWNPLTTVRVVATLSGKLDWGLPYFTSGKPVVVAPEGAVTDAPANVRVVSGDWPAVLAQLKAEFGVERLLLLGGSELNAQLLEADLVDELFLTVAPKVKLGREVPTYADGAPLSRDRLHRYRLLEHHAVGDEVFLRYRRAGTVT